MQKQISGYLAHVFVSSPQLKDHVEKRSNKDSPQNVYVISNECVDPVDPAVIVCKDEVPSINQNSPVQNSRELKQTRRRLQRERHLKM